MKFINKAIALSLLGLSMNTSAAIITNAGQVTGITEVNVNGVLYDVTLHNTLTSDLFPTPQFTADAWNFAQGASLALDTLFDGVYQDSSIDYVLNLALGCEATSNCNWFTPVGIITTPASLGSPATTFGRGLTFINTFDLGTPADFYMDRSGTYSDRDLNTDYSDTTFLSWAESQQIPTPAPIPIPAPLVLMSLGLAGIGLTRKRKPA
jgi:hypothetical protein